MVYITESAERSDDLTLEERLILVQKHRITDYLIVLKPYIKSKLVVIYKLTNQVVNFSD